MGSAFGIRTRLTGRRTCRRAAALLRCHSSVCARLPHALLGGGDSTDNRAHQTERHTARLLRNRRGILFIIVKPLRAAVAGGDKE